MTDSIQLMRLFDAALDAQPFAIDLAERMTPGAAAALLAWAKARGLTVIEQHVGADGGYANLSVSMRGGCERITVLHSRDLTADESNALKAKARHEVTVWSPSMAVRP